MEEKSKVDPAKKRSTAGKILRILFKTVLILILVFATIALLILTPPVQNFIKNKATTWLSNKLQTKVAVGKIYIGFPKKVVLEKIYVEDKTKDTLLAGGRVKVDVSMLKLLSNELEVSSVEISELTAKVKRVLPDTVYNFQFIIDAFASADTTTTTTDTAGMAISVKNVELDKIRMVYNDDVTGNDVTLWLGHFDTEIDEFDLDRMRFSVPATNISGIRANIYQKKPLVEPVEVVADTATAEPAPAVDVDFGEFNLEDIAVDYGNDVSAFYTNLHLGELNIEADDVDMQQQLIRLNEIHLNNTTARVRLGKSESAKVVEEEVEQETEQHANSGWRIYVGDLQLNNNNLAYANDNEPVLKQGMDYAHLDVKALTLHADKFVFAPDSIAGSITKGEMREQSGFELNKLQANFLYAAKEAYLRDLILETPGTTIRRSIALSYPSIDALQKDIGALRMNVDINDSRVQVKDILTFVPTLSSQPAFADPNATLYLTGKIDGSVSNMNIATLQIRGFNNTNLDVNGRIAGLPDAKKVNGNLIIKRIQTSKKDIQLFAPAGSLPKNITLPDNYVMNGSVSGSMQSGRLNLNLGTNLGSASVNGTFAEPTDSINAAYDLTLVARQLQLGIIMQNDTMYGPLTATVNAKGKGYAMKTLSTNVNATVNSAVYNRYNYKDVQLNASMAAQKAKFALNVQDPNIAIDMQGTGDMSRDFPAITLNALVDTINVQKLNFTKDTLAYKGQIAADFRNTDPANLKGNLYVTRSAITTGSMRIPFDTIAIEAGEADTGRFVRMHSDVLNFALTGQYNLTQLGSVFQQAIQPYYALGGTPNTDTIDDYNFRFAAELVDGPLLKAAMPTLGKLEPVRLRAQFATGQGFATQVNAPLIVVGTNTVQDARITARTTANALQVRTGIAQISAGEAVDIYTTTLNADIADNKVNFLLNLKDVNEKNKYRVGGMFEQLDSVSYAFRINPDSLMLNYDRWSMAADNLVRMRNGDINIRNFTISSKNQELSINSAADEANAPMNIKLTQFRIGTLTAFANQDSLLIDGVINGAAEVKNIATQPVFTTDLGITDLMFKKDTVGNLNVKVNNTQGNVYAADVRLTGKGNEVAITGNYYVQPSEKSYEMVLDLRRLQMASVQAITMGSIRDAAGFLHGKFEVSGTFDQPAIDGRLSFTDVEFTPAMLGSHFTIDNENIAVVDNRGVHFETFTIHDPLKNKLVIHGDALTTNFFNYEFNLDLEADNFQALNSTKADSKLFYGKFFFDADIHVGGNEMTPVVTGNLKVNDKTDFTLVMPQSDPGVEDREGIVRFVDMDSVRMDTTMQLAQLDSALKTDVRGMDVSLDIEIVKEAILTMIIDESNGDFLKMQGTAQLNGGVDPSGKTTLTGSYEIEEGAYQISLNLLRRKFDIQKGSKITWLGEPTQADVDLTAIYEANTAPLTLVENALDNPATKNLYKQKLPFQVQLILKGELLKPEITFDITLPEETNTNVDASVTTLVDTRLTQLRSQPSELNKQVFALLLLNRFIQENPFASSEGGGFNAGTVARQSVSKILSEQLNSLAADLITGVDVNFDVASTEDYTTGSMQNRTDLNVSLSKQLLNDRLRVTVGSNFELEGPQQTNQRQNNFAGNVALDYMLSKDGQYLLRAYRKNEYEGELDGYIIETGLNFILSFDYDHFHDLLKGRHKKEKTRNTRISEAEKNDNRKASIDPPVKN